MIVFNGFSLKIFFLMTKYSIVESYRGIVGNYRGMVNPALSQTLTTPPATRAHYPCRPPAFGPPDSGVIQTTHLNEKSTIESNP